MFVLKSLDLNSYELHGSLEYKLSKLSSMIQSRIESRLDRHGLTRAQWMALTGVEVEKKCSPSELAAHVGVSRPAISRMLKQMESDGLIERSLLGVDGRTRQLTITELGRQKINHCWPHIQAIEQYFINKLTEGQADGLSVAIDKLLLGENEALEKI